MARLFIALEIEPVAMDCLRPAFDFLSDHSPLLKTVRPDQYHITIKFIGECGAGVADDLARGFAELRPSATATGYELRGLGVFPDLRRASVLWCGIRTDMRVIREIFMEVERFTGAFGFAPEKRGFTPHLTLARVRKGMKLTAPVEKFIRENDETVFGRSEFGKITLFSSKLSSAGPEYSALHTILLPGK